MIWLYLLLGLLAVIVIGPLVTLALIVDDWSRDLTTNHAETTPSHPNADLHPITVSGDRSEIAQIVVEAVQDIPNWKVESTSKEARRTIIHATRTTKLMRFVDDIRIYLNDTDDGIHITATSQSRVGKGDLGQNPRNLIEVMNGIRQKLEP